MKIFFFIAIIVLSTEMYSQNCIVDSNRLKLVFKENTIRIEVKNRIGKNYLLKTFNHDQKKTILKPDDIFTFFDLFIDSSYFTIAEVRIKKRNLISIDRISGLLKDKNILIYKLRQCRNDLIFVYSSKDQKEKIDKILSCF